MAHGFLFEELEAVPLFRTEAFQLRAGRGFAVLHDMRDARHAHEAEPVRKRLRRGKLFKMQAGFHKGQGAFTMRDAHLHRAVRARDFHKAGAGLAFAAQQAEGIQHRGKGARGVQAEFPAHHVEARPAFKAHIAHLFAADMLAVHDGAGHGGAAFCGNVFRTEEYGRVAAGSDLPEFMHGLPHGKKAASG